MRPTNPPPVVSARKARIARIVLVLGAALAGSGAPHVARAEEAAVERVGAADVEVRNGDTIATHLAAEETNTFRLRAPVGAALRVSCRGSGAAPVTFAVADPSGEARVRRTVPGGGTATFSGRATLEGLHRIDVGHRGRGSGAVRLALRWKAPTSHRAASPDPGTPIVQRIDLEETARVRVAVTTSDRKPVAATITVAAPGDVAVDLIPGDEPGTAFFLAPCPGPFEIRAEAPGSPGGLRSVVQVVAPRPERRRIDPERLLEEARGVRVTVGGEQGRRIVQRRVSCLGGVVEALPLRAGEPILEDLEGTRLEIDPGTVVAGTTFTITSSAETLPVVGRSPVSANLVFDAEGRLFPTPVRATVNFGLVPADDSAPEVNTRSGGVVSLVPGVLDGVRTGALAFPAAHFSEFQAFGNEAQIAFLAELDVLDGAIGISSELVDLGLFLVGVDAVLFLPVRGADPVLFAGGGAGKADGTHRLAFDFTETNDAQVQGLQTICRGFLPDRQVVVASPTRIYGIGTDGAVTRLAGNGTTANTGDGGPARDAGLGDCGRVVCTFDGDLYFTTTDHRVRRVRASDGVVLNVLGDGTPGVSESGTPLPDVRLDHPVALCIDVRNRLYVGDRRRIYRLDLTTGAFDVVVGDASPMDGAAGDRSPLGNVRLGEVVDMEISLFNDDNLVAADTSGQVLWSFDLAADRAHVVAGRLGTEAAVTPDLQTGPGVLSRPFWVVAGLEDVAFGAIRRPPNPFELPAFGIFYLDTVPDR